MKKKKLDNIKKILKDFHITCECDGTKNNPVYGHDGDCTMVNIIQAMKCVSDTSQTEIDDLKELLIDARPFDNIIKDQMCWCSGQDTLCVTPQCIHNRTALGIE